MSDIQNGFSKSYAQARQKFLSAAQAAGLTVDSNIHPLKGRDGEELAMDVVFDGAPDAQHLLVISSACHGVEGYCGSGVQVHALQNAAWRAAAKAQGVAVLYIHALNPHGFSHVRRVTHENVDINRNFQDFSKPLPDNPAYREIQPLLLPEVWPPDAANAAATAQYIAERGMKAYQAAIAYGDADAEAILKDYGNDPRVIRLLARVGGEMGEDRSVTPPGGGIPSGQTVETLMTSEAYNNQRHPEHATVSRQVADHFARQAEAAAKSGNVPIL